MSLFGIRTDPFYVCNQIAHHLLIVSSSLISIPIYRFDGLHADDILGMHAIVKGYWVKGNTEIEAYYRRKSIEEEWIWVVGKVHSVMEQPVLGLIIQERRPLSDKVATNVNKIIRIVTTIAIAIEESYTLTRLSEPRPPGVHNSVGENNSSELEKEILPLKVILDQQMRHEPLHSSSILQNIFISGSQTQKNESSKNVYFKNQRNDISTILEIIREGPSIDVSKITLKPSQVKLLTMLIMGSVTADEVASHMLNPANVRKCLDDYLQVFLKLPVQSHPEPMMLPPITSINFSCTWLGNTGMEHLSETLYATLPYLKVIDVSFCGIGEQGILALCKAIHSRRKRKLRSLQGIILSCNSISLKAAKELGIALSPIRELVSASFGEEHDDGDHSNESDQHLDDNDTFFRPKRRKSITRNDRQKSKIFSSTEIFDDLGIQLLHISSCSMDSKSILQLLSHLSVDSKLSELDISSNHIGSKGIGIIVDFLEGEKYRKKSNTVVMPNLTRLNFSDNNLCNEGITILTRLVAKRSMKASISDLHLSFNDIGSSSTETLMNKLMNHNLVRLSLDNNKIGDSGCQLVAATLMSMPHLSCLNLSFNQIACRGVTALMRALLGCESITYLGLSGNVMKISGAIAMGYALAHHPRLAHLDLDNCCLSQVSQCHISAGMISNRLVPMQSLNGFRIGPPLAAIGALDLIAQHLDNTQCLTIRRNMQMKANLEWLEVQKEARMYGTHQVYATNDCSDIDYIITNESNAASSQTAYVRMLDWLTRIPFDDEELNTLRRYFYDIEDESPDGLRGSDGRLNLKVRGDLLAALGSHLEQQLRENERNINFPKGPSVGMDIDLFHSRGIPDSSLDGNPLISPHAVWNSLRLLDASCNYLFADYFKTHSSELNISHRNCSSSSLSKADLVHSESERSQRSMTSRSSNSGSTKNTLKARISMFPHFLEKLDLLKTNAQVMMDEEKDPHQQDIIAQQFAEASLILLRQLRYHCMNSGLDGWRHSNKIKRKVLIVDDSMVTRKLVSRAFEKANFIVDNAENGEEGLKMMKESIYDIAFMDIDMPVMNGFDATKALRQWENSARPGARQPICALTAQYVDEFDIDDLMKFKDAGIDVMESKPCNMPRLFKVVDDVSPLYTDLEQLAH